MKKNAKRRVVKLGVKREILCRLSERELRMIDGGHIETDANACGPPLPSWELHC